MLSSLNPVHFLWHLHLIDEAFLLVSQCDNTLEIISKRNVDPSRNFCRRLCATRESEIEKKREPNRDIKRWENKHDSVCQ